MSRMPALVRTSDRRVFTLFALTSAAVAAVGFARGVSVQVAARARAGDTAWLDGVAGSRIAQGLDERAHRAAQLGDDERHHARSVRTILARNVFDSEAGDLWCASHPTDVDCAARGDAPREPHAGAARAWGNGREARAAWPACAGSGRVRGVVESADPGWSFALLAAAPDTSASPRRRGDRFENAEIERVGWNPHVGGYVLLDQPDGGRCYYAEVMPPPPPRDEASRRTSDSTSGRTSATRDDGSIVRSSPNDVTVDRALVRRVLDNPVELMQTIRIAPQSENGRMTRAQIFGVRPGSLLDRLGIQNGDQLRAVDGRELGGPDRMLELLMRLPTIDHMTLSLQRSGRPLNLDVHIR